MPGRFGLKLAGTLCYCLFAAAVFAQAANTTAPGTQNSKPAAVSPPDNPEPENNNPNQAQKNQQGTAPDKQAPSLGDLGFPSEETKSNPEEQARLDKRSHMLRIHQRLGLITTVPLVATVVTGSFAGGRSTSSTNRDLHAALGATTAGLYIATASYAIFAPKPHGIETRGPIRVHKALAWIHGPGMILTPILGAMAFEQKSRGEKVHGIASAHGPVAYVTAAAYGAAIASVSFKF